jgi:membrane associated rhomboid family serine protease
MLRSIYNDLKAEFDYGNRVNQLVIINIAIFVVASILNFILFLSNGGKPSWIFKQIIKYMAMSSDGMFVITHPWIILTNMFFHLEFFHILWNMLLFIWFGRVTGDFLGNHRIFFLYFCGGIMGSLLFFLSANLLPYGAGGTRMALGASAAIMSVVVAAGTIAPDYNFRLLLIGDVKLKFIVLALLLIDLISITANTNTGGHFAHLGGAIFGWVFVRLLQEGHDLSLPFNRLAEYIQYLFSSNKSSHRRNNPLKVIHKSNRPKSKPIAEREVKKGSSIDYQAQLDNILDKIKQKGYDSLTDEEKEFLFQASKK